MTFTPKDPNKPKKQRKPRAGLSLKTVSIERVNKQLLNVLSREVSNLLISSNKGKLNKDDATALCNYLKLMKTLSEEEEKTLSSLSTEELEALT